MLVTILNDFHGTSTRTCVGSKNSGQLRAIKRRLCGVKGCTCSNELGARGPQPQRKVGQKLTASWLRQGYVILGVE